MATYYVSSEIGNNNSAGTSESAPLATLQAARALAKPGDTVEVMNGTYTGPQGGAVLDITTSGTASAPITFEAAPGQILLSTAQAPGTLSTSGTYCPRQSRAHCACARRMVYEFGQPYRQREFCYRRFY